MTRQRITVGTVARHAAVAAAMALLLSSCPLPYQFSVAGVRNESTSVDPSTPAITAAPVVSYSASSGSGTVTSGSSAETAADTTISLSSATAGAVIYYTVNGTTPDPRSAATSKYSPSSPLALAVASPSVETATASLTVMAAAIGPNMKPSPVTTATVNVRYPQTAAPTFSLAGTVYHTDQSLVLSCATPGADIYYTMRSGNVAAERPVPGQPGTSKYAGPIALSGPSNIWSIGAIAVKSQMIDSTLASAVYEVSWASPAPPAFTPAPGLCVNDLQVTISSDPDATILYTTNGEIPGAVGTATAEIPSGSQIMLSGNLGPVDLRAIARKPGYGDSPMSQGVYSFQAARPYPSTPGGVYFQTIVVALWSETSWSQIHYTTDGSTPTPSSPVYSTPIPVTTGMTIRSFAMKPGYLDSPERDDTYFLYAAPTTFSAPGGWYSGPLSVTLNNATPGANIYYTVDGTTPTASSPQYTGTAIQIPNGKQTTLQAMAAAPGFAVAMTSVTYTVAVSPPPLRLGVATSSTMVVSIAPLTEPANYYYSLYRSINPTFSPETLVATGPSIAVVDGLEPATTYYYRGILVYPDIVTGIGLGPVSGMTLDADSLPCIVPVTIPGPYATPPGYVADFYLNATTFDTTATAALALREGGYIFIPYSDRTDNGNTVTVRTFDSTGAFVKDTVLTGTRYVWAVSTNPNTGVITYTGQSGGTASISWPALMIQ